MVEKKLSRSKRGARRHGRYPTQALVLKGDEMSRGGRAAMAAFPLKRDEIRTRLGRCALPATSRPRPLRCDVPWRLLQTALVRVMAMPEFKNHTPQSRCDPGYFATSLFGDPPNAWSFFQQKKYAEDDHEGFLI